MSAVDNHDPNPTVVCDHGTTAGGTFPLGTTSVTCTAHDAAGNTSPPQSFAVSVVDTTPPAAPDAFGPAVQPTERDQPPVSEPIADDPAAPASSEQAAVCEGRISSV